MSESGSGKPSGDSTDDLKEFAEPKYQNKEWLHQKYHVEGLTQRGMSDLVGMNPGTISYWMSKHGIDCPDGPTAKRLVPPKLRTRHDGYVWAGGNGPTKRGGMVHPLVAIADGADPYEVYSEQGVVHHKNGVRWDNRPENLEVTTNSKHIKQHHENGDMDYSGLLYVDDR